MENSYKIILYNKSVFKEIELSSERTVLAVGTGKECDVRFNIEAFFNEFQFIIRNVRGIWQIVCGENIYISDSNAMKVASKGLSHGDTFSIKYQSSNQEIFKLIFTLNFDIQKYNYDRLVHISGKSEMSFGSKPDCDFILHDDLLENKAASIKKTDSGWLLYDNDSKYGVFINGKRIGREQNIKNYDFFSILGFSFYLKNDCLYFDKNEKIELKNLKAKAVQRKGSCLEYPKFNRNTRLKYIVSDELIPILDPDKKPEKPKSNLIASLIPSLAMIFLIVVVRGGMLSVKTNTSAGSSGNSYILFSVCAMGVGILTSVITLFSNKKDYHGSIKKREDVYLKYIENKGKEVDEIRHQEKDLLNDIYISLDNELQLVKDFSGDLFDKTADDEDFLHVRLGIGSLPARRQIDYKKQERLETSDILVTKPEDLYNEFKNIDDVPVIIKFGELNAVGVIGTTDMLYQTMKNMIIDICVRHNNNDVKLFFILTKEDAQRFRWARWFQNLNNDTLDVRNIVCDDESKNNLFEYLYVELSKRESEKKDRPRMVVMVFDDVGIKLHPLSKYIEKAKDLGFTFVFFENYKELLPQGCQNIVILNPDGCTGRLLPSADVNSGNDFKYSTIPDEDAWLIAQRLASVYCEEIGLESSLTKNITLFELLDILNVKDIDLAQRWSSSEVYKSMAAPLGIKRKNEIVYLDLHEKAHGPHGLVAGTTGSGKSEILQSYILSMSTLFHPYEVSFVIIDFKGGGMVNQFKDLPHLVGAITNIDGKEIDRSLLSIKAELLKRQNLFAQSDVNHIDKYIKKYKDGVVKVPLPHLIIVVDEFAELKAEQPDFMKELISTARIGRSLGVHLILATQKPSGQVNEQIWSNSRFKLCLKVQTKEDSNEVIKSPLAAEIIEPGRAYLQVGNNEIFELFQSAYSGCPDKMDDNGRQSDYALFSVDIAGRKKVIYSQKFDKKSGATRTQLEALVDFVNVYCKTNAITKLPNICLPPLPELLDFSIEAEVYKKRGSIYIPIGVYDDPSSQYQGPAIIDVSAKNTIIIGSAQYGKTNLLQNVVRNLATSYTPEEVVVYIIDFGSMVLKNFESLKHVGGVVCSSEDEKLKNLFKLLNGEISSRKDKLVSSGVSSFSSYREAGYTDLPQIVLLIDNITALKELYLEDDDSLMFICREGLAVGISIVVANSQTTGIGYKYLSNFSNRIALYCNDSGEYNNLFDYCKIKPNNIPGRCIMDIDKKIFECQSFLTFNGEKEIDRVKQMREFINETNAKYSHSKVKMIPVIPQILTDKYLEDQFSDDYCEGYNIIVGFDYSSVEPFVMNLSQMGAIGLCGKEKSGRGNLVRHFIRTLNSRKADAPAEVCIIDDVSRKFAELKTFEIVTRYSLDIETVREVFDKWDKELQKRYQNLMDGKVEAIEKSSLLLMIIQNNDIADLISNDVDLMSKYRAMTSKYRALKVGFIFSNYENTSFSYGSPEPLKMIKEAKHLFGFYNLDNFKAFDLPYTIIKEYKKPLETGDAYYFNDENITKLKMALSTNKK